MVELEQYPNMYNKLHTAFCSLLLRFALGIFCLFGWALVLCNLGTKKMLVI